MLFFFLFATFIPAYWTGCTLCFCGNIYIFTGLVVYHVSVNRKEGND